MAIKGLKGVYKFGDFSLDVATKELRGLHGSRTVHGRLFDVLLMLVRCAQRVVSSNEIIDAVWHDKVDAPDPENLLHNSISELRKMLGDESPPGHKYIKNIRGEGYRLIPDVIEENVLTVVAVIPLKAKDGFTSTGEFVGGALRSVGEVSVIPTEEVRRRLRTCHQALSLGHRLAADYVFRWEIEPMGSRLVIRNTSMDVRAGQRFGEYIPDLTDAALTDIEKEIAPRAARDLKRALNLRDQERRKSPSTRNPQAHSLYWRAHTARRI